MNNENWLKIWEVADAPIFEMSFGTILSIDHQMKTFGYVSKGMLLHAKKEILEAYHSTQDLEEASSYGHKFFLNVEKYRSHINDIINLLYKVDQNYIATYSSKINSAKSVNDLLAMLEEIGLDQIKLFSFFNTTNPQFTSQIEKELKISIESLHDKKDAQKILEVLTLSVRKTTLHLEQEDFYKILTEFKSQIDPSNSELLSKLDDHAAKYKDLSGNEGAGEWDVDYFLNLIQQIDLTNIEEHYKELTEFSEILEKSKLKIVEEYNLSKDIIKLADILSNLAYFRLELRIRWSYIFKLLRQITYKLSREIQVPAYQLMQFTVQELPIQLKNSSWESNDRYEAYTFTILDNKLNTKLYGEEAIEFFRSLNINDENTNSDELHGDVAYEGLVEGQAYCLNWSDEDFNKKVHNMPVGAILVIGNTRPSLMPAIRKAKAIITDEGGITSHAAIVSRELKIPCIIGTKNATKVLVTNDRLIVDAYKGIIKKA